MCCVYQVTSLEAPGDEESYGRPGLTALGEQSGCAGASLAFGVAVLDTSSCPLASL